MKSLLSILLFLSSYSYGQTIYNPNPYDIRIAFDQFTREDSVDGLLTNIRLLNIISDTIPIFSEREDAWKELKKIHFFYDSSNTLKRVLYTDKLKGTYYFYFDGPYVRKARHHKNGLSIDSTYYFITADHEYTVPQIAQIITNAPGQKEFFELLEMSKLFYKKFKMLLQKESIPFK